MRIATVTIVMCLAFAPAALAVVTQDSSTWEGGEEFSVNSTGNMVADYGWTVWVGNPAAVTSVSGGVFNFKPTVGYTLWKQNAATGTLGAADWSYEWRVQVISITGANPLLYSDNNSSNENVQFLINFAGGGQIEAVNHNYTSVPPPEVSANNSTGGIAYSDWHVYRMTRTTGTVGTLYSLYLDDNPVPIDTADVLMKDNNSDNWFGFGNGDATGEYNIDYFRWTTEGAFAPPIPEPASMALVGLGGLSALLIRRRR